MMLVLLQDLRLGLISPQFMSKGCFDNHFVQDGSVLEGNGQGVGNGSLLWIMIIRSELWVFYAGDSLSQALDQFRSGSFSAINVVSRFKSVERKHGSNHVLDAMITVRKVVHGLELFVNDTNASLMRAIDHSLDIRSRFAHLLELLVDPLSRLNSRLAVEFGWVRYLEEHILHDVATIWSLEHKRLALEANIVESPNGGSQHAWDTAFALLNLQAEIHGNFAGVSGCPGFTRHGVWSVTVGTKGLAIDPGLRDGGLGLLGTQAEHFADDGSAGNFDVDDVVETHSVEAVFQGQAALDFVCLDHCFQYVLDLEDFAIPEVAACAVRARDPIGDGQDGTKVVRWMTPFGGEPAVVKVQPADHGSNVEGAADGVELVVGSWDLGTVGDDGARHDRTEKLGAFGEFECLETAAEGVEEDITGGIILCMSC
jgi:hypothetical protein